MSYRVEEKKLLFLHQLISLPEDTLAKQFYVQQKCNNFPGLILECQQILNKYNLTDITQSKELPTKITWKKMVKSKVNDFYEAELKRDIKEKYSTLEDIVTENEEFERKSYLKELNLAQARIKFKL